MRRLFHFYCIIFRRGPFTVMATVVFTSIFFFTLDQYISQGTWSSLNTYKMLCYLCEVKWHLLRVRSLIKDFRIKRFLLSKIFYKKCQNQMVSWDTLWVCYTKLKVYLPLLSHRCLLFIKLHDLECSVEGQGLQIRIRIWFLKKIIIEILIENFLEIAF